jgi:hypothetical protein
MGVQLRRSASPSQRQWTQVDYFVQNSHQRLNLLYVQQQQFNVVVTALLLELLVNITGRQ